MSGKHIFSLNVDFSQRELLNAVLQNLFQAPLVPIEGQIYYDSFYNVPHYWNENEWIPWQRPVHKSYVSQVAMIADQSLQLKSFIYHDGSSYWEYLGTTVGDITDYRQFAGGGGTYVHPTYSPYNITLTGATVIDNIQTDTIGSVVNITTRELTLLDLGYSGNTNADYYGNWILNINDIQTYVVESQDIINIQEGDNISIDISGNTITISSQDTIYTHPIYTPIDLILTGATVLSTITTDNIGSVISGTTRILTPSDIGAEPEFFKGNIIIPINSGLSYTGNTENRLVGTDDLTIINNDKGSDQNIFKEIRDLSGNTAISATTNNDFIQIEGESGTTVTFESGNKVIISSPEQDNIVRVHEINSNLFNLDNPIIPQLVTYVNTLVTPIVISQTDSKLNFHIINETIDEECDIIIELVNKGKGTYGIGYNLINENDLLIIQDNCGLCCDNFVRVLYVPCEFVDFNLPLKPQIVTYINQLDPPLVIEKTDSKYNIVIDCEQSGTTVSCENGIDVLFLLDYTGSMGSIIDTIKNSITDITQNIVNISGGNYRLALALFDEYSSSSLPNYSNSTFYNELLTNGQVYINNGTSDKQYITLVTDFSLSNISEFESNIAKIRVGTTNVPSNFPLGSGSANPEPYDIALDVCINGTPFTGSTRTEFLSPFRNNVNKQIILITDNLPSGINDSYDLTDRNFINGQLSTDILSKNIKLSLLSVYTPITTSAFDSSDTYLQTFTFDGFNRTFTLNNNVFGNLNIQINNQPIRLTLEQYSINFINKTFTIVDTVSLTSGDLIKVLYQSNAILNIVKQSNGAYIKSYSPTTINETIDVGCTNTTPPTIIYQISGVGLGNTELLACLNYNSSQVLYTFCESISLGCDLYYDNEGSVVVNNYDYVSINDVVYNISNAGEIVSISTFNCNNIVDTFSHTGIGYANTSQNACDDATLNNRLVYSDCSLLTSGCTIYIDQYGLSPLSGYTNIFIDEQVWDINNTTGELIVVSSTQCSVPITIYTQNNSGYGNTSQDACDDADLNNRTLYSDCSLITSGCTIYTDLSGTTILSGYTSVFIDGKVWDINNTTGEIIAFSSTQCTTITLISFTGCGYGNTEITTCNDAIINNRTLYVNCGVIDIGCEIYTDIDGNFPLTGYNYVSIDTTIWEINLGNIILGVASIQC
jgi:hypothetical protein